MAAVATSLMQRSSRQPVRAPTAPNSTQTSTCRIAPAAVRAWPINSTPRTESTQQMRWNSGSASSSHASQAKPAGSTNSLASTTSRTPNVRKVRT